MSLSPGRVLPKRWKGFASVVLLYSRPAEDRCCMQRPKSRDVQRVYTSQSALVRLGDPQVEPRCQCQMCGRS